MNEFNPLNQYYNYMMSLGLGHFRPLHEGIRKYGPMLGIVLHRHDQFQTEMFIVPPGIELVEFHNHPNVDSFELHVCGDFIFESNGLQYKSEAPAVHLGVKVPVYVPAEHIHGGLFKTGGSFLSFQYWKNGVKPSSVGEDFNVDHNNPNHLKNLKGLDRTDKPVVINVPK